LEAPDPSVACHHGVMTGDSGVVNADF
jgi:hypothetical protein